MNQLTLNFEAGLVERFATAREYLAHRVQVQAKPLKTIAADMDLSPSTLSRKLSPGDGDTQRFNLDDLERYIQVTRDTSLIDYLAAKYLASDADRKARAVDRFERLLADASVALAAMKQQP
jgi:hypothetical protein